MIMQHINSGVKAKARMSLSKYDIPEQESSMDRSIQGQFLGIQYRGYESIHIFEMSCDILPVMAY